ncbi:hypothetical protein DERF_004919 [Dermatophagoides farinae]|uniref:Uncharacterized protein n=1 Tax=Dermatophagoides farinae TaxID=6954 RepID=A0A922LAM8_DERFA|nr:hypothetical protein DERF_004919 [Dermatophagoides farinae]
MTFEASSIYRRPTNRQQQQQQQHQSIGSRSNIMMANMRYLYNETFCAEIIMMMIIIKNNDLKGKCYHFTCIELLSSSSKTRISD